MIEKNTEIMYDMFAEHRMDRDHPFTERTESLVRDKRLWNNIDPDCKGNRPS